MTFICFLANQCLNCLPLLISPFLLEVILIQRRQWRKGPCVLFLFIIRVYADHLSFWRWNEFWVCSFLTDIWIFTNRVELRHLWRWLLLVSKFLQRICQVDRSGEFRLEQGVFKRSIFAFLFFVLLRGTRGFLFEQKVLLYYLISWWSEKVLIIIILISKVEWFCFSSLRNLVR